nr:myosin heavy chain, cardiac muscle isoform-like isoform X2 [Ipomoea batatas]
MMGEEVMRTVEFLRGRLLAERVASRKAKEAAQLMGNKLVYLETKLKEETKSINKAEKRLKFLKKKLECMNVSYVSDESGNSSYEVLSIPSTSTPYSSTKDSANCYQKMEKMKTGNDSSESLSAKCETKETGDAIEEENMMSSLGKANLVESSKLEFNGNHDLSMANGNRRTSHEMKEMDAENNLVREENVDDSLAIVPVEILKTKQTIDPDVLDETVREVLGSLRHAKEKLQNQMDRRRLKQCLLPDLPFPNP